MANKNFFIPFTKILNYWAKVQKRKDNTEKYRMILLLFITYYHPNASFGVVFPYFSVFSGAKCSLSQQIGKGKNCLLGNFLCLLDTAKQLTT